MCNRGTKVFSVVQGLPMKYVLMEEGHSCLFLWLVVRPSLPRIASEYCVWECCVYWILQWWCTNTPGKRPTITSESCVWEYCPLDSALMMWAGVGAVLPLLQTALQSSNPVFWLNVKPKKHIPSLREEKGKSRTIPPLLDGCGAKNCKNPPKVRQFPFCLAFIVHPPSNTESMPITNPCY